jgi:hypothetical protein
MREQPNLRLKAEIIATYGTLTNGARRMGLKDEFRLSRLIHGRAKPTPREMRVIAWKLQRPIRELFPNGPGE